jgi:hypothetical protein
MFPHLEKLFLMDFITMGHICRYETMGVTETEYKVVCTIVGTE